MAITPTTPATNNNGTQLAPDVQLHRKLQTLESSDFFKGLDPKKKIGAYKEVYNRYVVPFNQAKGSNISFFDFVKGRSPQGKKSYLADNTPAVAKISESAVSAVLEAGNSLYERGLKQQHLGDKDRYPLFEKAVNEQRKWMTSHFNDKSTMDSVYKGVGELSVQLPVFELSEGILSGVGLKSLLTGKAAQLGWKARVGSRLLYNAANGYLVGKFTNDDPYKSALGFALGDEVLHGALKPFEHFYGKVMGMGGTKLVSQAIEHASESVAKKDVAATVAPVTAAIAGTPKQKITAATVRMLNELVGDGGWAKATPEAKKAAIKKLSKAAPELESQLSVISPNVEMAKQHLDIVTQRKSSPMFDNLMTKLEQTSGEPASKTLQEYTAQKTAINAVKSGKVKIVPGAASAKSLEFEDNLSAKVNQQLGKLGLGKNKIVWEDRGHKLLFYLNLLLTDNKMMGASKERNKLFESTLTHLQQRYPSATTPELVKMSDAVWSKLENLTKAGIMKEGEPVRFFRQSELREGESPFGHEVELLREAGKKDIIESGLEETKPAEPQWPAEYKNAPKTLSSTGGGGANYDAKKLEDLKKSLKERGKI